MSYRYPLGQGGSLGATSSNPKNHCNLLSVLWNLNLDLCGLPVNGFGTTLLHVCNAFVLNLCSAETAAY